MECQVINGTLAVTAFLELLNTLTHLHRFWQIGHATHAHPVPIATAVLPFTIYTHDRIIGVCHGLLLINNILKNVLLTAIASSPMVQTRAAMVQRVQLQMVLTAVSKVPQDHCVHCAKQDCFVTLLLHEREATHPVLMNVPTAIAMVQVVKQLEIVA